MSELTYSLNEIGRVVQKVLDTHPPRERAVVIGLLGDLGAGKTTLVQTIAGQLGIQERVTSPTFVLEKIYPLKNQPFKRLVHIDAYRMERPEELASLGWDDLVNDPGNLILLEWPERVASLMPKDATIIKLAIIDEHTRSLAF